MPDQADGAGCEGNLITAVDDREIAQEAMEVGAVDYVTKPLDLNYLDALVMFQLLE